MAPGTPPPPRMLTSAYRKAAIFTLIFYFYVNKKSLDLLELLEKLGEAFVEYPQPQRMEEGTKRGRGGGGGGGLENKVEHVEHGNFQFMTA